MFKTIKFGLEILIIFISIWLIVLCSLPDVKNFKLDHPKFHNMKEACCWVNNNIEYKKDKYGDIWKLPQETLDDKNGDCEDMALLLMGIMNYQKNIKSNLVVIEGRTKNVSHAIVEFNKIYYDCTSGTTFKKPKTKILYILDYDLAMTTAKYKNF